MAASVNLCSRDMLKANLGVGGTAHDARLDALIAAASEAIETFCRRRFGESSYTEYHDGGHDRIVLLHRPVLSVTGLWDDLARQFDEASAVAETEYILDAERGLIVLRSGRFALGIRNVKASYSAGYAAVPDDVEQACILLAADWFHRAQSGDEPTDIAWPEPARQLIAPYRGHIL